MLNFVNYLSDWEIDTRTLDNPALTTGRGRRRAYDIGIRVASRIVSLRATLGGIFTNLEQLNRVPGLGQDKVDDIAFTIEHFDPATMSLVTPQAVWGNRAQMFVDGPMCLDQLIRDIRSAEHYINMSVMLFFNDMAGRMVAAELAARARDGVAVRLMVDFEATMMGYYGSTGATSLGRANFWELASEMGSAGVAIVNTAIEAYPDIMWPGTARRLLDAGVPAEFVVLQGFVQHAVQLGLFAGNHRKFMVVDGRTASIGSFNIGDNYLYTVPLRDGLPEDVRQWHDGYARIEGPFVSLLNRLFASQWMVAPGGDVFNFEEHFRPDSQQGTDVCTLLISFPGNPTNVVRDYLFNLVRAAPGEVIIENPYITDEAFYGVLGDIPSAQAQRVTLVNPYNDEINDHPTNDEAVRCNMFEPFRNGVRFFNYSSGRRMSHLKIALDVANNAVFHGSYNLNNRSADGDFEANVLFHSAGFAAEVRRLLDHDLGLSRQITDQNEFHEDPSVHPECWYQDGLEVVFTT